MSEVVIERPRYHSDDSYHNYRPRYDKNDLDKLEDLPKHEGMRRPHNTKEFTDLLGPLEHFLISNVGRPWNDVHSEICEQISPNSTVQIHILGHVDQFVIDNTYYDEDGKICGGRRRWLHGNRVGAGEMYVHPDTGILSRMPEARIYNVREPGYKEAVSKLQELFGVYWYRYRTDRDIVEAAKNHLKVGPERELHKINGIWYWIIFQDVPPPFTDSWLDGQGKRHEKLVRRAGQDCLTGQNIYEGRYRAYKQQANRRELRRHGLKNDI